MFAQWGAARGRRVEAERGCIGSAKRKQLLGKLALGIGVGATFLQGCSTSGSGLGGIQNTTGGTGGGTGAIVARVEIASPARNQFILRATLPVPRGTFPRADQKTPFSVVDSDGTYAPTQVEAVTFYPDLSDGADVVEVLARVNRYPGFSEGSRAVYSVVDDPHTPGNIFLDQGILHLMNTPGSILLVARDVFGHAYVADLAGDLRELYGQNQLRMLKDGEVAKQMATYHVMLPTTTQVGAPNGALPHLFGAHSYFSAWRGENVMSLDLRVHNGFANTSSTSSADDPLGKVYFETLELWVPQGWTIVSSTPDPFFGPAGPAPQGSWTRVPIIRARSDGRMHVMPHQAQLHRRLVIAPADAQELARVFTEEQGLAFATRGSSSSGGELYSWWNHQTARYFPQRHRLPSLDHIGSPSVRSRLAGQFYGLNQMVRDGTSGNFPHDTPCLGWAHPWGSQYGGMTGGSEIFIFDGHLTAEGGSTEGYRLAQLTHRMYTDRHPVALYNLDGRPTRLENWLRNGSNGQYINMEFFLRLMPGSDPFGFNLAPQFQVSYVQTHGLAPDYESTLDGFQPIDFQHHIRYTRSPKQLIWLGNDAIAKDDMLMTAELARLTYHPFANSAAGSVQGSGLRSKMNFVQTYPGKGFAWGRGESWAFDALLTAYSIADSQWRAQVRPWFEIASDLIAQGQGSCNGFIQSILNPHMFDGTLRARQAIEQSITENALRGMIETVFRDVDLARVQQTEYVLEQSFYAMIGPMAWNNSWNGPANYLAVGPISLSQPPFCGAPVPGGQENGADHWQNWSSFAYAYELTGDSLFLTRAAQMLGGGDLLARLEAQNFNAIENRAALLALAQSY